MHPIIFVLCLGAPIPSEKDALSDFMKARVAQYAGALHPAIGQDRRLLAWLRYLDAQPETEFRPFQGHRLGAFVLGESARWTGGFFLDIANPHANKVLPSGYFLPIDGHIGSLLLFEWKGGGYRFVMQESSHATLLRVRPDRIRFDPKSGLPADQIVSILADVLGKDVSGKTNLRVGFRLPARLHPGSYVSNARGERIGSPWIDGWQDHVLVFVTEMDLCVLAFKARRDRQISTVGVHDEQWLPSNLLTPDGSSLVIDVLRNKRSARAFPAATVPIPK